METKLVAKASIQILNLPSEVFENIVDPKKMSKYFISKGSGKMDEGKMLTWSFPEFEGEFPVKVQKVTAGEYISFYWGEPDQEMLVEIHLKSYKNSTIVKVTETGMDNTPEGIEWLTGNTEGWSNFLCCLKAWMEYGISLRKGAFDYRFDQNFIETSV